MKILLLGKDGQVGRALLERLGALGHVVALGRQAETNPDSLIGDLADLEALRKTVRQLKPDMIVNAAAYTAVDKAESEAELAFLVNADAPRMLAEEMKGADGWLIHYSTDYVFDGQGSQPWQEDDTVAPINVYGASKLAGEIAIRESRCRHLILRTSWVYADEGTNFLRTMLRLGMERDRLTVVDDQVGAPTSATLLATATTHALERCRADPSLSGTYHCTASGATSWHGYAQFIFSQARARGASISIDPDAVVPVPSSSYTSAAARPANSRLDCHRFETAFNRRLPEWEIDVSATVERLIRAKAAG